jgi:hypothetical protein
VTPKIQFWSPFGHAEQKHQKSSKIDRGRAAMKGTAAEAEL